MTVRFPLKHFLRSFSGHTWAAQPPSALSPPLYCLMVSCKSPPVFPAPCAFQRKEKLEEFGPWSPGGKSLVTFLWRARASPWQPHLPDALLIVALLPPCVWAWCWAQGQEERTSSATETLALESEAKSVHAFFREVFFWSLMDLL